MKKQNKYTYYQNVVIKNEDDAIKSDIKNLKNSDKDKSDTLSIVIQSLDFYLSTHKKTYSSNKNSSTNIFEKEGCIRGVYYNEYKDCFEYSIDFGSFLTRVPEYLISEEKTKKYEFPKMMYTWNNKETFKEARYVQYIEKNKAVVMVFEKDSKTDLYKKRTVLFDNFEDIKKKPKPEDYDFELFSKNLHELLSYKNKMYGSSALKPLNIFSKQDSTTGLNQRLDDKLSRIKNSNIIRKNDLVDFIGYLTLYLKNCLGVEGHDILPVENILLILTKNLKLNHPLPEINEVLDIFKNKENCTSLLLKYKTSMIDGFLTILKDLSMSPKKDYQTYTFVLLSMFKKCVTLCIDLGYTDFKDLMD